MMPPDWIDEEYARRKAGIHRPLLPSQHDAVNARYPGTTLEYCCACGEPTGRAGRGEDSIYCDECDQGPFCWECWCRHEHNPDRDEWVRP